MSEDKDALFRTAAQGAERAPQAAALGFRLESFGGAKGAMSVAWREDLVGDPDSGVIASGVVTSLIDHTCGLAIAAQKIEPPAMPTTLDLRIDYLRPAAPRAGVTAEAHCYRMTRSIAFVRAQAWDEDPADPIATAQAAFMLKS